MFQKRKKFKEETTPTNRLHDRWEQQVFFLRRKYPNAEAGISAIVKAHTPKSETEFRPSEEALTALEKLSADLSERALELH
ncbi:MAG: hypothetical protein HY074_20270 [Deltaproteobacteria bacterium]|nr:hypothetical protein [Deltaproteobacteria bacterium]